MRVLIETYRQWEIYFDTYKEDFYTVSNECDRDQTKRSYASTKKFIDDYIKENDTFRPFYVQRMYTDILKVIGVRKDGAFMYEDKDGKKKQFSKYDERNYFLVDEANDHIFEKLAFLNKKAENLKKEIIETEDKVIKVTVEDYRKTL